MSVAAISFLIIGCFVILLVFATIFKKHNRAIFWSGAIASFLALCFLFAFGIFEPKVGDAQHNAAILCVSILLLAVSGLLARVASQPDKLLWNNGKHKAEIEEDTPSADLSSVTEKISQERVIESVPQDVEQKPDMIFEGVIIPKELDTPLARKVFAKAIELDLMKEDGHHYRWSERESKVLLAYMCGRIYCGDKPDYNEQKRKNYWMPGKWSVFPETALNNLFQTKDLSISRTNRVYDAAPHKSAMIDAIIDQYKDVFPKSSSAN